MDNLAQIAPKPTLQKVRFFHDQVIDEILLNPGSSQGELAKLFGYTESWMSIIVNSDAFKERLAERKAELIDPKIRATLQERLDAIAKRALDRIMARLDDNVKIPKDADLASFAKLGIGDRNNRTVAPVTNNLYVVALPPPAANSTAWAANLSRTPTPVPLVLENQAGV